MEAYDTAAEKVRIEGFPNPEADSLENGLAHIITGLQSIRLGMDTIGTTSLRLRRLARMRHNKQSGSRAQKPNAPLTRSA